MRQWLVNVHTLRTEGFELKTLALPESLARQTRRNFPRIDRERLTVAETVAPQGRNFLAIQVNQPTLRCLYGRQPQTVHADPFEGRILPGILHQLLQQGYHVGVLIDRHMVSFCGGKQQLVDDRREQTAKQRTLAIMKALHQLRQRQPHIIERLRPAVERLQAVHQYDLAVKA